MSKRLHNAILLFCFVVEIHAISVVSKAVAQDGKEFALPMPPFYDMPFWIEPGNKTALLVVLNPATSIGFVDTHQRAEFDLSSLRGDNMQFMKHSVGELLKDRSTMRPPALDASLYSQIGVQPIAVLGRESFGPMRLGFSPNKDMMYIRQGLGLTTNSTWKIETDLHFEEGRACGIIQIGEDSQSTIVDLTSTFGVSLPETAFAKLPTDQMLTLTEHISYARSLKINGYEIRSVSILHGPKISKPVIGFPVFRQMECELDFCEPVPVWRIKNVETRLRCVYRHDVMVEVTKTGLLVEEVPPSSVLQSFVQKGDTIVSISGVGTQRRLKCWLQELLVACVTQGGVVRVIRNGQEIEIDVPKNERLLQARNESLGES